MKFLLVTTAIAGALAIVFPAWAQTQSPYAAQPSPDAQQFYPSLTPEDAYRSGLINRWQLEQLEGPTPQALQGPSPNSDKNGEVR